VTISIQYIHSVTSELLGETLSTKIEEELIPKASTAHKVFMNKIFTGFPGIFIWEVDYVGQAGGKLIIKLSPNTDNVKSYVRVYKRVQYCGCRLRPSQQCNY
jgi:hypothetical protein